MQAFAEPIAAPEDIHAVIDHLAGEVAEMLRRDGMASRRLQLGWQRVDGAVLAHDVHLSRPSRDAAGFRRLLASAGEAVNPEFGLERMWMEAHDCSPQAPTAIGFDDGISVSESRASLIDRLVARLGHGAVLHFKSRECWQPEAAQYMAYPDMEEAGFAPSVIDGQVNSRVSGQVDRYLSSLSSDVSSNGSGAGACLTARPGQSGFWRIRIGCRLWRCCQTIHRHSSPGTGRPTGLCGPAVRNVSHRNGGTRQREHGRVIISAFRMIRVRASGCIVKVCRNGVRTLTGFCTGSLPAPPDAKRKTSRRCASGVLQQFQLSAGCGASA